MSAFKKLLKVIGWILLVVFILIMWCCGMAFFHHIGWDWVAIIMGCSLAMIPIWLLDQMGGY